MDSRCGVPSGVVVRDEELAFGCKGKVLEFFCKDRMAFVKFDCVKVKDSADEVNLLSSSEPSRGFVGEGGRGTLVGVGVSHFIVLENSVDDGGGVKSKIERGCSNWDILCCVAKLRLYFKEVAAKPQS